MTSSITKLSALAGCGALLLSGLATLPAYADGVPDAVTLNLRYAGVARTVQVTAPGTVADAIAQLRLAVDGDDRVAPALDTPLSDGLEVVVDVVSTATSTKKVTLKYATVTKNTKSMYKGDKKVVRKGRNGKATRTYLTTTVNGEATTVVLNEKITKKVIDKVVKVGTNGKRKINLARLAKWNKIAKCESGSRWHINTGNGYYGGLQFAQATWLSVGGADFASRADLASRAEQITVANRLYARAGLQPWGCRHAA